MRIVAPINIRKFLEERVKSLTIKLSGIVFVVKDEDPRSINFSSDFSILTISAAGISDLNNSFNKIGLLQAFYRFVGLHSISFGIFLLHASSALYQDKTIVFGDGGKMGKTLSSIELGLVGHEYLADEFVFWDSLSGAVFSDDDIPIHLRKEVRKHLSESHKIEESKEFVPKDFLKFNWQERRLLDLICYTSFSLGLEKTVVLTQSQAVDYAKTTISAHVQKLLNPVLDRFQFITMKDQANKNVQDKEVELFDHSSEYLKMVPLFNQAAEKLATQVPSIEIFTNNPCRIPDRVSELSLS